ncbi:MAG TPA: hypothetical protein VFW55_05490 [Propionicimonas sp.]|nr:hypothetical protein [Propionicimonas sp.]
MKQWWRTALVTVLVALTGIVAPVSVVAAWAQTQVSDTELFVAAYAPLSRDPAVQQALAAKLSSTIQERLDLPTLTQQLIDEVSGSRPVVGRLLPSLTGPLNSFVSDFIDKQVNGLVASDAFSQVWNVALRTTHTQFVALIRGDDGGPLTVTEGTIQLQLGPFVEAVKQRLVANGFPLAERIPPVTTAIDLVQLDAQAVAQAQTGYRLLSVVAEWLPWLLLLLPALALLVARDLRRTVIACGLAITAGIVVAWLAFRAVIARGTAVAAANGISDAAVAAITDGALGPMRGPALALGILGVVVAFLGWLTARPAQA